MARASYSKRPIRVLLPSSTLPAVAKRSGCIRAVSSEVAFLLALLHRRFGRLVIHARRAALRHGGARGFFDDLLDAERSGFDRAGAADVAHRAEANRNV